MPYPKFSKLKAILLFSYIQLSTVTCMLNWNWEQIQYLTHNFFRRLNFNKEIIYVTALFFIYQVFLVIDS